MRDWTVAFAIAIGFLTGTTLPAEGQDGPSCGARPPDTPVWLIILDSPSRVHAYAATVKKERVLRTDATTVVFESGRVVTSNVATVGDHLTSLGWTHRRLEIVASFPARQARPRAYD